jgi:hypothetical protein
MVLATSGLTGDGVVEGIDWVAQSIVRNIHVRQGGRDSWSVLRALAPSVYLPQVFRIRILAFFAESGSCSRLLLNQDHSGFRIQTEIFYEKFFLNKFTIENFF